MRPYYERGGITIYHGDCREVLPTLEAGSVDLVLTDPPYGEHQAFWDTARPHPAVWKEFARLLVDGGRLYYWGFWGHAPYVIEQAKAVGLTPQSRIVWWFRTGRPQKWAYREDTEDAWYFSKGVPAYFDVSEDLEPYEDASNYKRYGRTGKHPGTVWLASRVLHNHPENVGHETQKPLSLITKMVRVSSAPQELILDPFMGSGTTLLAAQQLGRRAIGIEIEEKYAEIAARRLEQEVLPLVAVGG